MYIMIYIYYNVFDYLILKINLDNQIHYLIESTRVRVRVNIDLQFYTSKLYRLILIV